MERTKHYHIFLLVILLSYPCIIFAGLIEKIQFTRPDGSTLTGYLTRPENHDQYPVAMIVHGSQCESVWTWHEDFYPIGLKVGSALVTLEKQGIYAQDDIDVIEYDETNTLQHRIDDHLFFIEKLREGNLIPKWNGHMIMIGGSEGGRVAAAVSAKTPEVDVTALFTCGGGISTADELSLAMLKYFKSHGDSDAAVAEAQVYLDRQMEEMKANPAADKKFMEYTYKWWVSHFNHNTLDDFIKIDHPIYYAHGTADVVVPIESADKVAEKMEELGKANFVYQRIEGCGHDMRTFPPEVVDEMLKVIARVNHRLFTK